MTKEEEAIKILSDSNILFNIQRDTALSIRVAIETVLNMLKEKDKLINEQLKENVKLQKELNEENKRCMILANDDKFKEQVIDLMAEEINETDRGYTDYCEMKIECDRNCKDCIKRYYERKSKE